MADSDSHYRIGFSNLLATEKKNPSPREIYDITCGIRLKLDMSV